MLQTLRYWREQCSKEQLEGFEQALAALCKDKITPNNLKKRYSGSFHQSLINQLTLNLAKNTGNKRPAWGYASESLGDKFVQDLARGIGWIAIHQVDKTLKQTVEKLLQRGLLFKRDGKYCLPAECVVALRGKGESASWLTLVTGMPIALLRKLVPQAAQSAMLQIPAGKNELAAWLVAHGEEQRSLCLKQLDEKDWSFLLLLDQQRVSDFGQMESFYPELENNIVFEAHGVQTASLRLTLEKSIPDGLRKLCQLGLLAIPLTTGSNSFSSVVLCAEGKEAIKKTLPKFRAKTLAKTKEHWFTEACDIERPSALYWEQEIWQLWTALHFMPLGLTQQQDLRKNDLKKISKVMGDHKEGILRLLIQHMVSSGLLMQKDNELFPARIDWKGWARALQESILKIIKGWVHWSSSEETRALKLLGELPTECWLDLGKVILWLELQARGKLDHANWQALFVQSQHIALSHFNMEKQRIYLLPQFHAVLHKKIPTFSVPGWHGANKKAKTSGFISAAGEIQLPPDCKHDVLPKLAAFCTLTSVEHMITLQLDEKALQRMGTNKQILQCTRELLESLQSPLPQAVAYLFDKQLKQKPVAAVAATSLIIHLHDLTALQRLQRAGFALSQPFKGHPEIVLLDASADAAAFMEACVKEGILLDTAVAPLAWITGTMNIKTWMDSSENRCNQWLELAYQKTRTAKVKQVYACVLDDYYGRVDVQCARKSKNGYTLLKTSVLLEPKHVLRLRELSMDEIQSLGLEKLL